MRDLNALRSDIDAVDAAITELYEKRMALALEVGEYKLKKSLPVHDAAREEELYGNRERLLKNPENREGLRELFELLTRHSRSAQHAVTRQPEKYNSCGEE